MQCDKDECVYWPANKHAHKKVSCSDDQLRTSVTLLEATDAEPVLPDSNCVKCVHQCTYTVYVCVCVVFHAGWRMRDRPYYYVALGTEAVLHFPARYCEQR